MVNWHNRNNQEEDKSCSCEEGPFWKVHLGRVKIVTWTCHHSGTVMLYQICFCLMRWVLKISLSCGWPFWCEKECVSSNHRVLCTCCLTAWLLLFFLGGVLHNTSFKNRWTVVWYHVIGSHLCFLLLELKADAGILLRDFHALIHRTGSRKLLESSQNVWSTLTQPNS